MDAVASGELGTSGASEDRAQSMVKRGEAGCSVVNQGWTCRGNEAWEMRANAFGNKCRKGAENGRESWDQALEARAVGPITRGRHGGQSLEDILEPRLLEAAEHWRQLSIGGSQALEPSTGGSQALEPSTGGS